MKGIIDFKREILLILIILILIACGNKTVDKDTSTISTDLINKFMDITFKSQKKVFEKEEKKISHSDNVYDDLYEETFLTYVNAFFNDTFDYVEKISKKYDLNIESVSELYNTYQNSYITYMDTYTNEHMSSHEKTFDEYQSIIANLKGDITSLYDIALLELETI